jgi:hypothetical protein
MISSTVKKLFLNPMIISLIITFGCAEESMVDSIDTDDIQDLGIDQRTVATPSTSLDFDQSVEPEADYDYDQATSEIACQLTALHQSNVTACLDMLDYSMGTCDLNGDIFYALKTSDIETDFSCRDQDGDCSYLCDGWTLPPLLQDPDDRRASIRADQDMPNMANQGSIYPQGNLLCTSPVEEDTESLNICRYDVIFREVSLIKECENDGILWIEPSEEREGGFQVNLGWFDLTSNVTIPPLRVPIDFQPSQIACALDTDFNWNVLLAHSSSNLIYQFDNGNTRFEPIVLNETLIPRVEERDLDLLMVNESRLFSWSYSNSRNSQLDDLNRPITVWRFSNSRLYYGDLPSQVIDQQMRCLTCNNVSMRLRSAYLMDDLTVKLSEEGFEHELFNERGPFKAIDSSDQLLALVPNEEEVTHLIFSLWSEASSLDPTMMDSTLLDFPLIFDASAWGFQSVTLKAMNGLNVLVTLKESNAEIDETESLKTTWGVYNALSDRLQLIDKDELISQLSALGIGNNLEWGDPLLHHSWVSWPVQENGILNLITIQLSP